MKVLIVNMGGEMVYILAQRLPGTPSQGLGFAVFGGFGLRTQRPLSSSFLGLPYRVLYIYHKKELLRGLWVRLVQTGFSLAFIALG